MRRFSVNVAPYVHALDQGRFIVVDQSSSRWGHINVDDFTVSTQPTSLSSQVLVRDDEGLSVAGAEVFSNGVRVGLTNSSGIWAGSLRPGDRLAARKRIHEEATYRAGHSAGSSQNWKFRVYLTSLTVGSDGSAPPVLAHGDSAVTEVLTVRRNNAIIGLKRGRFK